MQIKVKFGRFTTKSSLLFISSCCLLIFLQLKPAIFLQLKPAAVVALADFLLSDNSQEKA
jgi:hypothetical protein